MAYDRKEFLEVVKQKSQQRALDNMPFLRAAAAVAPVMESLITTSEHWDRYLTYLSGFIKQAEAFKHGAQLKLNDPAIWQADVLMKLKSDILVAESAIQAWTSAMELPKALIQGGEEAVNSISRFEEANEKSTGNANA